MSKNKKRGITLASLVIYIILFTGFTAFVTSMSNNMSAKLFDDRGEAINYSNLNKLQYNIEDSALKSYDVMVTANQINYSNGDNYIYNKDEKILYKNNGILCQNVEGFEVTIETLPNGKKVVLNVSFNKYLNTMTRTVVSCVEGV